MAHTSLIYVKVKKAGFHSNSPSWSHLQIQFCKVTIFCTGTCKTPCFLCFHSCSRLRCQKLSQSGEAVRVLKLPVGLLEQKVLTGVGVKAGLLSVYLFCSRPSQTSANILRCCKVLTRSEKQAVIQLVWRLCKQQKKSDLFCSKLLFLPEPTDWNTERNIYARHCHHPYWIFQLRPISNWSPSVS